MRDVDNGTLRRPWHRPSAWRVFLLAEFLPCLLALGSGNAQATSKAATAAGQSSSTAAPDWRRMYKHNLTHADLYGIACPTSRTCVVVGVWGTILTTSDDGATWRSRPSGIDNNLHAVTCLTSRACLAVGYGTILASADGGATWTVRSSGTSRS